MRIGIDIDGTVNNFQDIASKYIEKEYGFKWDGNSYEIYPNLTSKEIHDFMSRHNQDFLNEVKPLEYARQGIVDLLNAKNQVFFITARDYSVAEDTLQWLKKNKFMYTDIYFNCGNKVATCKWKELDYMIEDCPYNLMELAKNNIPFIVYDQKYNQEIKGEVYRSNNWEHIIDFLNYCS